MQLMMRLCVLTLMVGALAGQSRADLSVQFSSADTTSNGVPFSAGFSFTTTATEQVIALDFYGPLATGNAVRLYDGSGNVLASALVLTTDPTESTGGRTYNVHTLDTPTTLAANTTYYIVGDYDPEGVGEPAQSTLSKALNMTTIDGITYNHGVSMFVPAGHGNPTTDQVGGVLDPAYFGVNFDLASAVATPEPSTLVLAACGVPALLVMGYRRYRRRVV